VPTDTDTISGLLISRLGQLSRLTTRLLDLRLKPLGISFQEMRLIGLLIGESNTTQKQLASKLSVRPATLSVALSKLEQQGLVKRVTNPEDRRVNYLQLVPQDNLGGVDDILYDLEGILTEGITNQELQTTQKVVTQIIQNLDMQLGQ